MKQKVLLGISLCSLLVLTGCVSEQTYVGSDRPVSDRSFDNIEAARTRISLGLNYLRRGDTSQAKYNLERARSFAPNSAEVYSALAYYYQTVGENKQAEEYFRTAISKDVNYADAYNNYGAFLCQLSRYDEAEQLLLKAVSRRGYIRVAESYENLALCQLQQNNFVKASSYMDSSLSHNGTRISSLTLAAGLAYAMGDNNLAKQRLDRIQRLGRVSARTVLLSYLIADKSGDSQTKRNAEQLLLTLYTETPETRLLLQSKTAASEFEMLRERYKDSLMANVVVPDAAAKPMPVPVPAKPVANPKLKIVKRKAGEAEPDAAVASVNRPRTERVNTASDIANILSANTAAVVPAVPAVTAAAATPEVTTPESGPVEQAPEPVIEPTGATAAVQAEPQVITQPSQPDSDVIEQVDTAQAEPQVIAQPPQPDHDVNEVVDIAQADPATPEQSALPDTQAAETANATAVLPEPAVAVSETAETVAAVKPQPLPAEQPIEQAALTEPVPLAETVVPDTNRDTELAAQATEAELPAETMAEGDSAEIDADLSAAQSETDVPFHVVQAAESLYAISVKHNIRLQRLMQWNQLTPESVIKTGQKIWLGPVSEQQLQAVEADVNARQQVVAESPYHVVSSGETMFSISYRYNIRLDRFMAWNGFNENSTLMVGQRVYVVDPESIE